MNKKLLEKLEENFAKEMDRQINRTISRAIDESKKHSWYNKLKKQAQNPPSNYQTTIKWYQDNIKELL